MTTKFRTSPENTGARDNSGGFDFRPHKGAFGDADFRVGEKPHLTPGGGGVEDAVVGDELDRTRHAIRDRASGRFAEKD
jgi:hypothetical protein